MASVRRCSSTYPLMSNPGTMSKIASNSSRHLSLPSYANIPLALLTVTFAGGPQNSFVAWHIFFLPPPTVTAPAVVALPPLPPLPPA